MKSLTIPSEWFRLYDAAGDSVAALQKVVCREIGTAGVSALRIVNASAGPDPHAFWHEVGCTLGRSYTITAGAAVGAVLHRDHHWMDVRFEPNRRNSFRYASVAQPLHSDGAHVEAPADYALFFMEKQAGSGGETVLLDAATIAGVAAEEDPEFFRSLTELPIHMALPPGPGSHAPVLQWAGDRWSIRWNYYRVVPGQGERVVAFCDRLNAFLERLATSNHAVTFLLEPGDALIFDDRALLHARRPFTATESGDRILWKTYYVR